MDKVARRRLFAGLGICLSIALFLMIVTGSEAPIHDIQALPDKELVLDEAKFQIRPLLVTDESGQHVEFIVGYRSYQNPEILNMNLKNHVVLEMNDLILEPESWELIEQESYYRRGRLVFRTPPSDTQLTLTVFTSEAHVFDWKVPTGSVSLAVN